MSRKLFKSTLIVSSMTLTSRLLGFVRDMVLAIIFGAGPAFDAFVVAFKIPNFMRRLFGEGAFAQAFVPVLSDYRANHSEKTVREFISCIMGSLGTAVLLTVAVIEIAAPLIVMIFAPGFLNDPTRLTYTTEMLRITSPYLFLIALTAFAGAILNTFGYFSVPAFTPVVLNMAMIASAWFLAPYTSQPIYALTWGVLMGGFLQLIINLPSLYRLKVLPMPRWGWRDPGVLRVLKLMVPALFGVSIAQISLLVDSFFASFLPVGSISWLYYSDRLTYLPLGVIGVALATVVLPNLSRQHSMKSSEAYSATLDWALRVAILIGIPAAIALFILAGPLIVTLIYHGAFTEKDVMMTRQSLCAFSIGLPGFMLIKILASAFYSRQDIKTPVRIALVSIGINLILNIVFIRSWAHAGLALATSLASTCNAFLLLYFLLRRSIYVPAANWRQLILQTLFSNLCMAAVLLWFLEGMKDWLSWSVEKRISHLVLIILFGFLTYLMALSISGFRPRHLQLATNVD